MDKSTHPYRHVGAAVKTVLLLGLALMVALGGAGAAAGTMVGTLAPGLQPPALTPVWTFSGGVYRGQPGDYRTPLAGVTVAIYGANSTRGWGTWIRETTTNRSGAFSLSVSGYDGDYAYYNIVETDPSGYVSTGAFSGSGGEVVSANWIRFHNPSPGGYAENFFWDVPSPTATPTATTYRPTHTPSATATPTPTATGTRTPSATPTATAWSYVWEFSGVVWVTPIQLPAPRVEVSLYGSHHPLELEQRVDATLTGEDGSFVLHYVPGPGATVLQTYPYLILVVTDARYRVVNAWSESGGEVVAGTRLVWHEPPTGQYGGNGFEVASVAGTPTPTPTATVTPGGVQIVNLCAVEDAYVNQMAPGANYGDSAWLYVGTYWGQHENGISRSLVRFDLGWLPADTDIHSASLELQASSASGASTVDIRAYPIADDWQEMSVTWASQPLVDAAVATTPVGLSVPTVYAWDVTDLVREWVSGTRHNLGLELRGHESLSDWLRGFDSRHYSPYFTPFCPRLVLNFTAHHPVQTPTPLPTPTPTPTATSPCPAGDAGNFFAAATPLTLYSEVQEYICPSGDVDWWKFSVVSGQEITVFLYDMPRAPDADYDLFLVSPTYGSVASSERWGADKDEYISYIAQQSGEYRVLVRGKGVADWSWKHPYKLLARVCYPDEAGDTPDTAATISSGTTVIGRLCPAGDVDWYAFPVPPGQATINATLSNLPKNYYIELYDPDNMPRDSSEQNGPPQETISYVAMNRPGIWKLAVRGLPLGNPAWDATNPYHLRVTVPPLPDLTFMGMEVVQVTQNTAGTIPLVANKATMVRVYVNSGWGQSTVIPNVAVRLTARKGSTILGTLTRTGTIGNLSLANARLDLWRSVNFVLPTSWLSAGTLNLSAQVNPDNAIPETNYANNTGNKQAVFYTASPAHVWLVNVQANNLSPATNDANLAASLAFLGDIFPIPKVQIWGVPNWQWVANYNYVTNGIVCENGWTDLLDDLQDLYDGWKNRPANATVYGYMHQSVNSPFVAGCGRTGVAAGKLGTNGNRTMAHEVGHAYNLPHAPCGGAANTDPSWPTTTNPNAIIGEVGVRPAAGNLFNPNNAYDLMSYCKPAWFSPYNYKKLLKITAPSAPASAAASEAFNLAHIAGDEPYVIISGRLADDGSLALRPFWQDAFAPGQYDDEGNGPYAIELRGNEAQVLFTRRFDPFSGPQGGDHEIGHFHEILPYPAGVRYIVFRHGDQTLREVPVSAHAPQAHWIRPHGGDSWEGAGPFPAAWEMSDVDGDLLTAQILYSRDAGETWMPVAVNLRAGEALLDGRSLGGSQQARLRLRVSDGVNTTEVDSELFQIARKAPLALITHPRMATVYAPDEPVPLQGFASDAEDGMLPDEALAWDSSLDGHLGVGASLFVDTLSPGHHVITLTATDGDGQVSTASVEILISRHRLYLPIVQRSD